MAQLLNIFNNKERPNKEEIFSYYPQYYRDFKEMDAIVGLAGQQCDDMAQAMEEVANNRFVDRMDEEATARAEVFYFLTGNESRTLSERRNIVKSTRMGFGKISATKIKSIIATFTNANVDVSFPPNVNRLQIVINKQDESTLYLSDIEDSISKRLPAHIGVDQTVRLSHSIVVTGHIEDVYSYTFSHSSEQPYTVLTI